MLDKIRKMHTGKLSESVNKIRIMYTGNLRDTIIIIPTSWNIFIAIATMFGVIDLLGPIFRYLIASWQDITRGMWDYLITFLSKIILPDIYLRDADKDSLTFCLFFVLFGWSFFIETIKIARSQKDDELRLTNWKLFPIAFVVSSLVVLIVVSTVTSLSTGDRLKIVTFIFYTVFNCFIFFFISFCPIFISYCLDIGYRKFSSSNHKRFKEIFAVTTIIYSLVAALGVFSFYQLIDFIKGTILVAAIVTFWTFLIPIVMPIIQPRKLIRLALFCILIGTLSIASYTVDYLRKRAIAVKVGKIENVTSGYGMRKVKQLSKSCFEGFSSISFASPIFKYGLRKKGTDIYKFCDCVAEAIVRNESTSHIEHIIEDYNNIESLGETKYVEYLTPCIPNK